ncbi:hypothetical protein QZH41_007923 [Actinostola sp. cb2023]|nr:hypothetical protein QZH41_007923 [Actinostola sp. cb2023]
MGYDSYFLLEWLCARGQRPEVVMRGTKCMYMYVKSLNLKFKDSLCFLPMALCKFSKTFNLPEEKGYFPHFFNRSQNQDYVVPYPALEYYGIESMKESDVKTLRQWHTEQLGGYTPQDIQSLKAKKWLWWLEQQTSGLRLHTCYSVEGKAMILGAKVDGCTTPNYDKRWAMCATTSTELFGGYVRTYLRLKQEASGWPSWCHTEEDPQQYLDEHGEHEGIRLEHVEYNPGLRSLAKLMLTSLWGKFGQNPHLPVTEYVDHPKQFAELMFGPKTEVKHLLLIHEDLVQVQYDRVDDFMGESSFASVVHAAFVTSLARLKLYRWLEELQERVLYFDTDSNFYVTHLGQTSVPLGDYLGDLTSELKPGDFIREFVSTGPKSYAYVTDQGHKEVKCKDIPLNVTSSAVVNFKSMLRLVEGMQEKYVVTEPHRIQRDAKRRQLKTVQVSKDFRVVYD